MINLAKISFWISCIVLIDRTAIQIDGNDTFINENLDLSKQQSPSAFRIYDSEKFFLGDLYCLKSITVRAYLTNDTFDGENSPSMRLDILWESDHNMTSLNVESDSLDDPYCDSKDRFSYHRKPIKKNIHTFPDLVNYGSRYIPIRLDCKYIIIPELTHPCAPVRLKYSTPVCLSENTCSCRNTSLPAPNLEIKMEHTGVMVSWEMVDIAFVDISELVKIYVILEISKGFIPRKAEDIYPKEFSSYVSVDSVKRGGRHFFALNATHHRDYAIKGYFENIFGCSGNLTHLSFHFPDGPRGSSHLFLYVIFFTLILLALMLLIFHFARRKFGRLLCNKLLFIEQERHIQALDNNENIFPSRGFQEFTCVTNPLYSSDVQNVQDLFVIDYQQLIFKRKLAEGNFGIVHLAHSRTLIKGYKEFAVKQLKNTTSKEDLEDFIEEMKTFKKAGSHPHIVRMIGYCKAPHPLSIVMEYLPFNLLEYLKNLRDEFDAKKSTKANKSINGLARKTAFRHCSHESLPSNYISANEVESAPLTGECEEELEYVLDNRELESFGLQIARGMEHLERNSIVHRDLAARNVLIDNYKTLKISDFGMSRTGIYVNKTNRKFPLRWMSPEAVTNRTFSSKSDVWSYGIVLWEIGTLGGFPYCNLQNDEVLSLLRKGGHPDQPESVTLPLYNLMLQCWAFSPDNRPGFSEIVKKIENLRQKAYVDFTDLGNNYTLPPTEDDFGGDDSW